MIMDDIIDRLRDVERENTHLRAALAINDQARDSLAGQVAMLTDALKTMRSFAGTMVRNPARPWSGPDPYETTNAALLKASTTAKAYRKQIEAKAYERAAKMLAHYVSGDDLYALGINEGRKYGVGLLEQLAKEAADAK